MLRHDLPPSVDLKTPSPHDELWRLLFSPVPTHTRFASVGAMATSPIDAVASLSKTGVKVVPLLTVFHTPLVARRT